MGEVDELGGAVACIESGWTQRKIADSAYRLQRRIESGERIVVGVNRHAETGAEPVEIMKISPRHQVAQTRALKRLRASRPQAVGEKHLADLDTASPGPDNLMIPLKAALAHYG